MPTATISAGVDTFTLLADPDAAHNTLGYLTVEKNAAEALVYFPITLPPTATIATIISAMMNSQLAIARGRAVAGRCYVPSLARPGGQRGH